jgi:NADH dehydrogenase FAD-containing subunit
VLLGEAVYFDPGGKLVTLADGARLPYDSLIVSAGSQSNYYGNDAWRLWSPSLKRVEEATACADEIPPLRYFDQDDIAVTGRAAAAEPAISRSAPDR